MVKEPKWYIFNKEFEPLCWEDKALEFDTYEDAKIYLRSAIKESSHSDDFWDDVQIIECIFYYDDGYIDGTGYIIEWNQNEEEKMIKRSSI